MSSSENEILSDIISTLSSGFEGLDFSKLSKKVDLTEFVNKNQVGECNIKHIANIYVESAYISMTSTINLNYNEKYYILAHEVGHFIYRSLNINPEYIYQFMNSGYFPTEYSKTNVEEYFCESLANAMTGRLNNKDLAFVTLAIIKLSLEKSEVKRNKLHSLIQERLPEVEKDYTKDNLSFRDLERDEYYQQSSRGL